MNLGIVAGSLLAVGALTYFTVAQTNEINHKKEIANQVKELQLLTKKQVLAGKNTKSGVISSLKQIGDIKMSSIVLNGDQKDKELLNKLQKAMEKVILEKNNPTCEDLSQTNLISFNDCEYILNKDLKYANIENGQIDVSEADNKLKAELIHSFRGINQKNVFEINKTNKNLMGTYKNIAIHKKNEVEVLNKNEKIIEKVANDDTIPVTLKVAIIKNKISLADKVVNNDNQANNASEVSHHHTNHQAEQVNNASEVVVKNRRKSKVNEFKAKMTIYLEIEKRRQMANLSNGRQHSIVNNDLNNLTHNISDSRRQYNVVNNNLNNFTHNISDSRRHSEIIMRINQERQRRLQLRKQREEERKQKSLQLENLSRFFGFGKF